MGATSGLSATLALGLGEHAVGVDLVDELGLESGLAAFAVGLRVLLRPPGQGGDARTLGALGRCERGEQPREQQDGDVHGGAYLGMRGFGPLQGGP